MSIFSRNARESTRVENSLRDQLEIANDQLMRLRNMLHERYADIVNYQKQLRLVNRAIQRRNRINANQRAKLNAVREAAINLRLAQRAYMADRGNDAFGNEVARAAQALDAVLGPYTPEDKRLAALANNKLPPRSAVDQLPGGPAYIDEPFVGAGLP